MDEDDDPQRFALGMRNAQLMVSVRLPAEYARALIAAGEHLERMRADDAVMPMDEDELTDLAGAVARLRAHLPSEGDPLIEVGEETAAFRAEIEQGHALAMEVLRDCGDGRPFMLFVDRSDESEATSSGAVELFAGGRHEDQAGIPRFLATVLEVVMESGRAMGIRFGIGYEQEAGEGEADEGV